MSLQLVGSVTMLDRLSIAGSSWDVSVVR